MVRSGSLYPANSVYHEPELSEKLYTPTAIWNKWVLDTSGIKAQGSQLIDLSEVPVKERKSMEKIYSDNKFVH